jgi:methylated-DNA-[protein]-cysteine S-methyltransferase
MKIQIAEFVSPIGEITLAVRGGALCALNFTDRWPRKEAKLKQRFGALEFDRAEDPAGVVSRLKSYFNGSLDALAGIVVETGGSEFQRRVWNRLLEIDPGQTISYGELAVSIGSPTAVRAVGAANGANPVGIVIPCHRVIGASGALTGYGGGIERKRWLLRHEGVELKERCNPREDSLFSYFTNHA